MKLFLAMKLSRKHYAQTNFLRARQFMRLCFSLSIESNPKWFKLLFLLQFQIYWHCLRPPFVLLIILWQNKHTKDLSQFIFHANLYTETVFKCRASFSFYFACYVCIMCIFFLYFFYCCLWWFFVFAWAKIGSTQHFLPIFRKLHQIKWTTCAFYPPKNTHNTHNRQQALLKETLNNNNTNKRKRKRKRKNNKTYSRHCIHDHLLSKLWSELNFSFVYHSTTMHILLFNLASVPDHVGPKKSY